MKPSKDEKNRSRKNPEHEEEPELISRLKEGDHQAFEALYHLYKNELLSFLVYKIGSIEESEDIVQDIFMKIWIERENIDKINNFRNYIFKMAINCMFDHFRKSSPKEEIILSDITLIEESTENLLLKQEQQQILQEAVNHLPPQQKKICKLHYEQELPLKEIAKELNISVSAVQNAINDALKNICKYIEKKNYF
jgi:RNA polymerase sigma-70 factor (ECF subfamily)